VVRKSGLPPTKQKGKRKKLHTDTYMRTFTEVPISVCFELSELRQVNKAEVMEANQNLVLIVFQQELKLHPVPVRKENIPFIRNDESPTRA
jgi:hypothetical protein